LPDVPLSRGSGEVQRKEGEKILVSLRPGAFTIALDRRGRMFTSEELSGFLLEKKLHGRSSFQFILGGAAGLHDDVLKVADVAWSLSALTFPHQLARCIVLEQLYRAVRIERGEPYHH
jgi:23S rRNA (pseudouridine1915-N3)-methyltransferase